MVLKFIPNDNDADTGRSKCENLGVGIVTEKQNLSVYSLTHLPNPSMLVLTLPKVSPQRASGCQNQLFAER